MKSFARWYVITTSQMFFEHQLPRLGGRHRPQALNLALLRVVHRSLAAQRIVEALEAEDSWKGWGAGEGEQLPPFAGMLTYIFGAIFGFLCREILHTFLLVDAWKTLRLQWDFDQEIWWLN